jgi:hypothetical protein
MKNSEEFMKEFMSTLNNMKKYQGIDITRPETYSGDFDKVHDAFDIEKRVVATIKAEEITETVSDCPKILRLTNKKQ